MYKVFINDREIVFTDNYSDYASEYSTVFIRFASDAVLLDLIELLRDSKEVNKIVVFCDDVESVWSMFKGKYVNIEAAGGVIKSKDRVLFIFKNNHWDLPKGKIEGSESLENTALREVKEECGIKDLSIIDDLETTYYLYKEKDSNVLKKTNWFLMTTPEEGPFKGDAKEGISEVKWMNKSDFSSPAIKSYPSVINLLSSIFTS